MDPRFVVLPPGERAPRVRPLSRLEGRIDRLRAAAYAEVQARDAFASAAARFEGAPSELRAAWLRLAREEQKHLDWLLGRMAALGGSPGARPVTGGLARALAACASPREFSQLMAAAEERGRRAGEAFETGMAAYDPDTAALFGRIAREEAGHIALARKFFG